MADVCQTTAAHADGVDFRHLLGNGTKRGHRTERDSLKVHVQAGNYHALAVARQFVAYIHQRRVKELRLINADHLSLGGEKQDAAGGIDRSGSDGVGVVGDDVFVGIAGIDGGFVDFHLLAGDACSLQASDEFFCLTGKHGTANDFDATLVNVGFFLIHGFWSLRVFNVMHLLYNSGKAYRSVLKIRKT